MTEETKLQNALTAIDERVYELTLNGKSYDEGTTGAKELARLEKKAQKIQERMEEMGYEAVC